jgi:hypothetical protein
MKAIHPGQPQAGEFVPFYANYIAKAGTIEDPVARLATQLSEVTSFLSGIDHRKRLYRYAPGKWSIQEMVQHLADSERIFGYRALRFARKDQTALAGFDENTYVPASEADNAEWGELVSGWGSVRNATVPLFRGFPAAAWTRTGTANNATLSVRAIAWIIIGHTEHHMGIIRERYL